MTEQWNVTDKKNQPSTAAESARDFNLNLNEITAEDRLRTTPQTVKRLFAPETGPSLIDLRIDTAAPTQPTESKAEQPKATETVQPTKTADTVGSLMEQKADQFAALKIEPDKDPVKWQFGFREMPGGSAQQYWIATGISYLSGGKIGSPTQAAWLAPFGAADLVKDVPRLFEAQSPLQAVKYGLRTVADIGMTAGAIGLVARSRMAMLGTIALASGVSKMMMDFIPDEITKTK